MLFLYDHDGKDIIIPNYDPQKTVVASSNAISVATISDMDGEVDIKLCIVKNPCVLQMVKLFGGHLIVDTGVLSICFMGDEKIASIKTLAGNSLIEIYGNRERFPDKVVITIVR